MEMILRDVQLMRVVDLILPTRGDIRVAVLGLMPLSGISRKA